MACCSHRITATTLHVPHRSPSFRCFRSLVFFFSVFGLPAHVFSCFVLFALSGVPVVASRCALLLGLLFMYYQCLAFLSYFCFFAFFVSHAHSFVCNVLKLFLFAVACSFLFKVNINYCSFVLFLGDAIFGVANPSCCGVDFMFEFLFFLTRSDHSIHQSDCMIKRCNAKPSARTETSQTNVVEAPKNWFPRESLRSPLVCVPVRPERARLMHLSHKARH